MGAPHSRHAREAENPSFAASSVNKTLPLCHPQGTLEWSSAPSTAHVPSSGPDFLSPRVHWLHSVASAQPASRPDVALESVQECAHSPGGIEEQSFERLNITRFQRRPSGTHDRYPSRAQTPVVTEGSTDGKQRRAPAADRGTECSDCLWGTKDDHAAKMISLEAGQTKRVEQWLATHLPPGSEESSERSSNADSATTFSTANTAFTDHASTKGADEMTIRVQAPAIFKVHKAARRMASRSAWPEGASQDSRRQQDAVVNKSEESEDITEDKEPKEESEESRHAEKDGVSNGAFSMSSVERMRRAMQRDAILSKDRLRQECTAAAAAFDAHLAVSAARASAVSASSAPNSPIKHSEQSEPEQSEPVLPASASSRAQSLLDDSASAGNGCHDESASHVIPPRVRTPRHHRPASTCGDSAGPAGGNDLYKSCADLRGRLQPCVQDLGSSSKKNAAPTCPGSSKSASN